MIVVICIEVACWFVISVAGPVKEAGWWIWDGEVMKRGDNRHAGPDD